jgi:hypothetical protein
MRITPVLFTRVILNGVKYIYPTVSEGCEWVQAGVGLASVKWDGLPVRFQDGEVWHRCVLPFTAAGENTPPPHGWVPSSPPDEALGLWPGWVPIRAYDPEFEVLAGLASKIPPGTFEFVGPKVRDNPHRLRAHRLIRHGADVLVSPPTDFPGLHQWLADQTTIEGVIWTHPAGMTVKIRRKDLGLDWPLGVPHSHQRRPCVSSS